MVAFLGRGGMEDTGEWGRLPQEPIQTLCLQSYHCWFDFCSPSVSSHCTSSLSELALLNKSRSWKKREMGSVKKVRLIHRTKKEQLESYVMLSKDEYLMQQRLCLLFCQCWKPPTCIQEWATATSCSSLLTTLISSSTFFSSGDSSVSETNPDIQGNISVRSKKGTEFTQ